MGSGSKERHLHKYAIFFRVVKYQLGEEDRAWVNVRRVLGMAGLPRALRPMERGAAGRDARRLQGNTEHPGQRPDWEGAG